MIKRQTDQFVVAITGASAGLGEALALEYAGPATNLFLCARRRAPLDKVAENCRTKGSECEVAVLDVREATHLQRWLEDCDDRHPIDLLIVNAGTFGGRSADRALEKTAQSKNIIETNLLGSIYTATPVMERMRARGQGHIAFISSLAALHPQPDAPAYSASKAGLTAYAEALREYVASENVVVSIVHPGNIDTDQTRSHKGWKPMTISARQAASRIRNSLDRGATNVEFPWLLRVLIWLNRFLPWRLRRLTNAPFRFFVEKQKSMN